MGLKGIRVERARYADRATSVRGEFESVSSSLHKHKSAPFPCSIQYRSLLSYTSAAAADQDGAGVCKCSHREIVSIVEFHGANEDGEAVYMQVKLGNRTRLRRTLCSSCSFYESNNCPAGPGTNCVCFAARSCIDTSIADGTPVRRLRRQLLSNRMRRCDGL